MVSADQLSTGARQLNREELATFLPNDRLIRAFEDLSGAVAGDIPDQVNSNAQAIAESDAQIAELTMIAASARGTAVQAAAGLSDLTAHVLNRRDESSWLTSLQRQIDELKLLVLGA